MLNSRAICWSLVLGVALVAQAPQEVLKRTPPPASTDGVARAGAGAYTLPSGERLVPARDPLAFRAMASAGAPAPSAPKITLGDSSAEAAKMALPGGAEAGQAGLRITPELRGQLEAKDAAQAAAQGGGDAAPDKVSQDLQRLMGGLERQKDEFLKGVAAAQNGPKVDGLDVDPEGAMILAKIDPKTGKVRRKASEIARDSGLCMIPSGTMLSVRTYTRVNTELGGTCIGVLEFDVWDAQMRSVAIPRGSRVLSAVQPVQGDAQGRAALIFRQIVDPNGDQIQLLVQEPATNSIGESGIGTSDGAILNRHLGEKFGYALAWGLLGGLTGRNSASPQSINATFSDMVRGNVASQFGNIGQNALQGGMNVKSTIEVPVNTSMRVILGNPIYVAPWKVVRPF